MPVGARGGAGGLQKKITALYLRKVMKGWDSENAWYCHLHHEVQFSLGNVFSGRLGWM